MAATFNIVIKVDANAAVTGTRQVERALDRTKSKAMEVNRAIRNLFGFFVVKEAVMGLYQLSDGYTVLQNRLRSVAKDTANLNGLTEATYKIAQETRSSWSATAELYARVARNSQGVGASQQDLLTVTRALNQAMIVGGATSMEASAGLVQLSQGLASGTLRGDELRAVLEQLPVVADTIAKHLKVTRGELRDLGKAGRIGAKDVIDAFKEAAPELEKEFAKTVPTIAQSFDMLKNAAEKFFGESGTGAGVLQGLARAIIFVSEHMETFGKVLLAVAEVLGAFLIIRTVIKLVEMLTVALMANPFVALAVAIALAISLLRQFGDEINTHMKIWQNVEGHFVTVGDILHVLWEDFKKLISIIGEFVSDAWQSLTGAFSDGISSEGIEGSLRNILVFIAGFVGSAVGLFTQVKEKAMSIFGGLAVTVGEAFIEVGRAIARAFGALVNEIIREINAMSDTLFGSINSGRMAQRLAEGKSKGLSGDELTKYAAQGTISGGPHLSTVNFDFNNPLAGAANATHDLITSGIKEAQAESQRFMQSMNDYIDSVERRARDFASERESKAPKSGYVDNNKGGVLPVKPTDAELRKLEALYRKLDQLMKKSNEVREAELKLAEAEDLLADPRIQKRLEEKYGVTASTVLEDYRKELEAALDPLGAFVTKTIELTAAMQGSREEAELAKDVQETINDLTNKGLTLTEAQIAQVTRLTKMQQDRARVWKIEQDTLDSIRGPMKTYHDTLEAINNLLARGAITKAEYNREFDKATAEYEKSNDAAYERWRAMNDKQDPLSAGAVDATEQIEKMVNLKDATADAIVSTARALEDFMVNSATSGKLAWEDAVKSIEQALVRLAAKILEQWVLMQAMNLLTPGAPGIAAAAIDQSDLGLGGGYSTGGTYMVGGVGGPDSQRVAFNLTPGERVDFTPPNSYAGRKGGQQTNTGRPPMQNVIIQNKWDDKEVLDVVGSADGERVILNVVKKNPDIIRQLIRR